MKTQIHPKIAALVNAMHAGLATHAGTPVKCAACNTTKPASPTWGVGAYQPFDLTKKAGAYLICPSCASSRDAINRAAEYVETALRDIDESEVSV